MSGVIIPSIEISGINMEKCYFNPASHFVTSGVRIGVTSITQRGLKEAEIEIIADIMDRVASAPEDEANIMSCKKDAESLISNFFLYLSGSFEN